MEGKGGGLCFGWGRGGGYDDTLSPTSTFRLHPQESAIVSPSKIVVAGDKVLQIDGQAGAKRSFAMLELVLTSQITISSVHKADLNILNAGGTVLRVGGAQVHLGAAGPPDGEHARVGGGGVHSGAVQVDRATPRSFAPFLLPPAAE